jgi:hypothetical protein
MMFLLSEKLYHINVICVTGFSRKPNIFLSKNVTPVGNYDTASGGRGRIEVRVIMGTINPLPLIPSHEGRGNSTS